MHVRHHDDPALDTTDGDRAGGCAGFGCGFVCGGGVGLWRGRAIDFHFVGGGHGVLFGVDVGGEDGRYEDEKVYQGLQSELWVG